MKRVLGALTVLLLAGCIAGPAAVPYKPSLAYSNLVRGSEAGSPVAGFRSPSAARPMGVDPRAQLHLASAAGVGEEPTFYQERSAFLDRRPYQGPLSVGDPGVSASLWKESRAGNHLFYDYRAWQPMDLLTIVVSENAEGKKEADTDVSSESSLELAIEKLFGIENNFSEIDPASLIKANSTSEFKGEGETTRKDSLKARISAMVVEVLPSGILRVEGEKIIAVNSEEQVMVISGLVRTRDISSDNEVDSSKVANMRIDYYGRGVVGEVQQGGWLGRIIRRVWPF